MSEVVVESARSYTALGWINVQRVYGTAERAPWLITLPRCDGLLWGRVVNNAPQAWAVVDDFGTLVAVEPWR